MQQARKQGNSVLPCTTMQPTNGSPVKPELQLHTGVWFTTLQRAFVPHDPGHGSLHFWFTHAKLLEHSGLIVHSGRQFGGDPI